MSERVRVHLSGRDYLLRTGGDADLVEEAAQLVERKLAGVPAALSADTRDRQMLAMLNLAGEYLQEKRKCEALETEKKQAGRAVETLERLKEHEAVLVKRIENALNS